jgi:N-acetylglucosaminyldiphosphoundecaprenol N-acetyl-beta-D-mannosaminyltransferase
MNSNTLALPRVQIGHALVHACLFEEMAEAILRTAALAEEPKYVVTPNVQHIALLARDKYLRQIYSEAAFVLPDGISLLLAGRVLGQRIPQRVAGVDMFETLCQLAAREGLGVFLLGGRPGSAEKAAAKLVLKYSGLIVSGTHCPPIGFEKDHWQREEIEARIRIARPHFLFVAFGAPKQEYWIYEHARQLGVPVTMGVGGSFEMVGGVIARAPRWVQSSGLEWSYRLLREPRRLWKRYLITIIQCAHVVVRQRFNMGKSCPDFRVDDIRPS